MTAVEVALLLVAHVSTPSDNWGNPVLWIVTAVILGVLLIAGFVLVRRPSRREVGRRPAGPDGQGDEQASTEN